MKQGVHTGKSARSSGGEVRPRNADREQGAWLAYQMKLRGVTQQKIADDLHVTQQMIQRVAYGVTTSGRVQRALATALGYESWRDLVGSRQGVAA
jgi:hypothetical protein